MRENDITPPNACLVEKDIGVVRVCNPNHHKEWKGLKNAVKVGITNTKKAYIVTLERDENNNEVLKVHTIKRNADDIIETLEGQLARRMFMKLSFY